MTNEEKIQKEFGDRLRAIRESKGISQEKLAVVANMDRSYVNSVENGKRNISLVNIVRIATALNKSVRDFFGP